MRARPVPLSFVSVIVGLGVFLGVGSLPPCAPQSLSSDEADRILTGLSRPFVPNLGQWEHRARFVHRSGPMTLFLEDRGWVLDLVESQARPNARPHEPKPPTMHQKTPGPGQADQKVRRVALKMTFEGDAHVPGIVGENRFPGHHNYFLGNDESRWRTGVPLYAAVRCENLYPGIDLRLREVKGVPEYDLLLQPGADLSLVTVHVEGAQGLSIGGDGSLVIETALGSVTQSVPKAWQVGGDGRKRKVVCNCTLLGPRTYGFTATGWDGDTSLTIDPGLIWSTFLGGAGLSGDSANALSVDARGVVTVAGFTYSTNFPTTSGVYDTTQNGSFDAFVSRLDPSKTGTAQLVYSTFLGGSDNDLANALSVDASGVATVAGYTRSSNFPTTRGAYDTTLNGVQGVRDVFVSRLDPSKTGSAQLAYSTFLGGRALDEANELFVDASGVTTVAGNTYSSNFPTTSGAYDTSHNGISDAFVIRLIPINIGTAGLVYSTFLGGGSDDSANTLSVDAGGVVTVAGATSSSSFPTTSGAYDRTLNAPAGDAFVSRLDLSKSGSAQLVYSTFLGGSDGDGAYALSVDANGAVTVAGATSSSNFPTTNGAFDTTFNSTALFSGGDAFVSRLDPSKTGTTQLAYSTFLGGGNHDWARALAVDANGVVTVAGSTSPNNFPTTSGAYDTTPNGWFDAFVSRLDPSKTGSAQLIYSSLLGGGYQDYANALSVDASGVATVAGYTLSTNFPATAGAYDATYNGGGPFGDAFVSRLSMSVALYGDVHEISITSGGTQKLTMDAGKRHATRLYWIFGSVTGTKPGVELASAIGCVRIPLNPDIWTDYTIALPNTATLTNTRAALDGSGTAQASFNIPKVNLPCAIGMVFYHAYLVYDANNNFYMASNPVPLKFVK